MLQGVTSKRTFPKRKATFKPAGGIQSCETSAMTCSQMSSDCARTVRNFGLGFLTNCYQEHCKNGVFAHISLPYTPCQKKGNFRKFAFLFGKSVWLGMLKSIGNRFRIPKFTLELKNVSVPIWLQRPELYNQC